MASVRRACPICGRADGRHDTYRHQKTEHGHSAWDRGLPEGNRGQVFTHEHKGGEVEHHHQYTTQPQYHPPKL